MKNTYVSHLGKVPRSLGTILCIGSPGRPPEFTPQQGRQGAPAAVPAAVLGSTRQDPRVLRYVQIFCTSVQTFVLVLRSPGTNSS